MTSLFVGGTQGLVVLQEQPFGWEVWERTDEVWWGRRVYAVALAPDGGALFVGTDVGLVRSYDGGETWERVLDQMVRTLLLDPHHPGRLYVGTQPAAAWRSDNWGDSWQELQGLGTPDERAEWHLPGATPLETVPVARVNTFAVEPLARGTLYAGVEIGGVWRSDDDGASWALRSAGLPSLGIHTLAPHPLEPETLFAATETGIYRTIDGGLSWKWRPFDAGAGYTRALLVLPPAGPDAHPTLFAGPAEVDLWGWTEERDGARSSLYRSVDDGSGQWEQLGSSHGLPDSFEGLISVLAADPADPYAIWLGTWDGRVYLSRDRGDSWTQAAEDLGDIWCLCPLSE